MLYRIYNYVNKRSKITDVIITQARNTTQTDTPREKDMLLGDTYMYTWGYYQYYYYKIAGKNKLPCHYFVELLDKDYVIYVGNPRINKSYFLEDLANAGVIDEKYKDALLITIGQTFTYSPMEERLIDHLTDKLLSSLMAEQYMEYSNIHSLQEVLVDGWEDKMIHNDLTYDILPEPYLYMDKLRQRVKYYNKDYKRGFRRERNI